jgi:Right handed beta helix region
VVRVSRGRRLAARIGLPIAAVTAVILLGALLVYLDRTTGTGAHPDDAGAQVGASAPDDGSASLSPGASASASAKASASASAKPKASGKPTTQSGPAGWPNAGNTGVPAGHKLSSSGAVRVTRAGAVIDGLDVHGDISVEANNVTIRNSRIVAAGTWAIIQRSGFSGLTVEDCDIHGDGVHQMQFGIFNIGGSLTIARNDISVISDGISTSNGLIVDNYLHDPKLFPGDHVDMIQSDSGPSGGGSLTVRHNTLINTLEQTSALALFQDFGVQHDALIENNLMAGGGYALYGGAGAKGKSYNIRVINNVFSRTVFQNSGYWGPAAYWDASGSGNVWQSNVWADTGAAIAP